MRRRIEELADRFEEFVSEDDHDCLVITCADDAVGLVGAAVDLTEQRGSIDVNVPFIEPFVDLAGVVARVAALGQELDSTLDPWLRDDCGEKALIPRLASLAEGLRRLGDVRVALWLVPSRIDDPSRYLETVRALVRDASITLPRIRIAVRELDGGSVARALRGDGHGLLEAGLDTSRTGFRDAFLEEAEDPAVPLAIRCASLLTVANIEAAEGRGETALALFGQLATLYAAQDDGSSRALCFLLAGNVLWQLDRIDEALERARQAFAIAAKANAIGVALSSASLAGQLAMRSQLLLEAEHHFDVAARLAGAVGAATMVSHLLTQRAEALEAIGRNDAARDALRCAVEAARRAKDTGQELVALRRLRRFEVDVDEREAIHARLHQLEATPATDSCHGHGS